MSEISSTALLWGYDALELRSVGGPEDRVPHVSERLIRSSCLEADLHVAAVDPELFQGAEGERAAWMNELAVFPEVVRFAKRIGCPAIVIGSLDDSGDGSGHDSGDGSGADNGRDSGADDILSHVLKEAGRHARAAGLDLHVRAGSPDRLSRVAETVRTHGIPGVRPLPEIELHDAESEIVLPPSAAEASYIRLLYHGPNSVSYDEAEDWRRAFGRAAERLAGQGFGGDVCLEFADRPDASSGLRVSTAFVSALSRA
ncbi:MAG: hypothetical protein HKN17_07670 [Rhodothermales bacterium]|nr:hypothetical protein [Rhodothermales bacterium]